MYNKQMKKKKKNNKKKILNNMNKQIWLDKNQMRF